MPEPTPADRPGSEPSRPGPDENAPGATGARRLWSALTARPSRGQLIAAVLLALLGYAAAVQIQLTNASNDFAGQRRQDLVELLGSLSGASDRAEQELGDLEQTHDDLQSSSTGRAAAIADAKRRLDDLRILAGTVAAVGPGVTITIADPERSVTAASLLNGIEELRDAGAEAIQVNHQVRLVQSSWVGGEPGAITVDGVRLEPPYVIQAIGSGHTLSDAIGFPGGLADEIASLGGSVSVRPEESVLVDALHRVERPQYSQPTGP